MENTDLEVPKAELNTIIATANLLVIENATDMEYATDLRHSVKEIKKKLTDRKEEMTRPLMQALASTRDLFRPLETLYSEAEKTINGKMLEFQDAEAERIKAQKVEAVKSLESGEITPETAIEKMAEAGTVPTSVEGKRGKITTRVVPKVRVIDESLIPREYLVPDLVKIAEAILQKGLEVPGAEKYDHRIIASR